MEPRKSEGDEDWHQEVEFASRVKTIKNCAEVNEVLDDETLLKTYQKEICEVRKQLTEVFDDGTLLKTYQKEICELRKQLTEMSQESSISRRMQELEIENEKMGEMLQQQRIHRVNRKRKFSDSAI
ncbi:kinesin-related protein 11-like isoform X2 [Acropora millepora]|uniref:kinesin-related protein 11-like isoform X2 n=1 Tax=Acropora millepora TaxID=45264 RepID=UPI001CF59A87|nr:kinesin-related protein 11-like isoform X2 [Acropora millepora]